MKVSCHVHRRLRQRGLAGVIRIRHWGPMW